MLRRKRLGFKSHGHDIQVNFVDTKWTHESSVSSARTGRLNWKTEKSTKWADIQLGKRQRELEGNKRRGIHFGSFFKIRLFRKGDIQNYETQALEHSPHPALRQTTNNIRKHSTQRACIFKAGKKFHSNKNGKIKVQINRREQKEEPYGRGERPKSKPKKNAAISRRSQSAGANQTGL